MRECEWRRLKKTNPQIKEFMFSEFHRPLDFKKMLTEQEILEAVLANTLIGVVECDIRVPDHLHEKLSEMCPIVKSVEIACDDIGEL